MSFHVHFVINVGDIASDKRLEFDAAYDRIAWWLYEHGAKTAQIIYVGEEIRVEPQLVSLAAPAADLVLPDLHPGNNLGVGMALACAKAPNDPKLIVIMSSFTDPDTKAIENVVIEGGGHLFTPYNFFLFVPSTDAEGRTMSQSLQDWINHNYYSAVAISGDPFGYANAIARLYSVLRHR